MAETLLPISTTQKGLWSRIPSTIPHHATIDEGVDTADDTDFIYYTRDEFSTFICRVAAPAVAGSWSEIQFRLRHMVTVNTVTDLFIEPRVNGVGLGEAEITVLHDTWKTDERSWFGSWSDLSNLELSFRAKVVGGGGSGPKSVRVSAAEAVVFSEPADDFIPTYAAAPWMEDWTRRRNFVFPY